MLRENDGRGAMGMGEAARECSTTAMPRSAARAPHSHKFRSTAIAIVLMATMVGTPIQCLASQADSNGSVAGTAAASGRRHDRRPRKLAIKPIRQSRGIKSGLVIAYGHPIQGPFAVSVKGGKILVNGVQVIPSLLDELDGKAQAQSVRASTMTISAHATSAEMQKMARQGVPKEKILEFAKGRPFIREVRDESRNSLTLVLEGDIPLVVMLPKTGEKPISKEEIARRSESAVNDRVVQIERRLKEGKCVVFVNGGLSTKVLASRFPGAIPKTMDNLDLDHDAKFRSLREFLNEPAAADILENYASEEWAFAR